MKTMKAFSIAAVTALTLVSGASFAQSISVTSGTLDGADSFHLLLYLLSKACALKQTLRKKV